MRAAISAFLVAAACQGVGSDEPADVAALLVESTPASTAEIRDVVEDALPGHRILLAKDAFTESSLLVIERRRHKRLEGTLSAGVADEAPHRFRLILDGGRCELKHLNTGKRHALTRTRCRAEEAAD
ncbi:MAG: hypothetical protein F4029_00010 [Gammaproteobacteria bacterium]|nr:hypothetical protein [Gammaproteobacteria bacterium]MYF27379.1 hypothetical protein [Gammaproteobacteria bacterium]MYK44596.1 hypothetical protein [Gammaproteobacteria bacterium]